MAGYEIKITLSAVKPKVWRKVLVPTYINFALLHNIINASMGWQNIHLHEFIFDKLKVTITNDKDSVEDYNFFISAEGKKAIEKMNESQLKFLPRRDIKMYNSQELLIDSLFDNQKVFTYNYDLGDGWEHTIEVLGIVEDYSEKYAQVIEYAENCPPEDIGGVYAYKDFLQMLKQRTIKGDSGALEFAEEQGYKEYNKQCVNEELRNFK